MVGEKKDHTVREWHLGFASTSGITFLKRSQSIKIPGPSSVIRVLPALTSRCKVWAFSYAIVWTVTNIELREISQPNVLLTYDGVANNFTQLSSWFECIQRLPKGLQYQSVMDIGIHTRLTGGHHSWPRPDHFTWSCDTGTSPARPNAGTLGIRASCSSRYTSPSFWISGLSVRQKSFRYTNLEPATS